MTVYPDVRAYPGVSERRGKVPTFQEQRDKNNMQIPQSQFITAPPN